MSNFLKKTTFSGIAGLSNELSFVSEIIMEGGQNVRTKIKGYMIILHTKRKILRLFKKKEKITDYL